MPAKNPLSCVTAPQCTGPTKILTSSRCAAVRINSFMKKKWAAVSVVAVVLVGIPPTARANSADAPSAMREKYKRWLAAYDAKNLAGTINIFAEDAISTFAGAKDAGIEEIRASYKKSLAANGPKRTWKPVEMEIDGDGDLAYALADWQLIETQPDGSGSVRLTNRSVDVLRREGETWKIVRSFTIPADKRPVKLSCEIRLPSISPDKFSGAAADVWQTLMRWRESYNRRDLAGTLAPYDPLITGLYEGNTPDDLAKLRETYTRSFAQTDRQRSIDFEPEEILASGRFAFVRDHWTSTIRTPQGQTQRISRGIELWQKNPAGEWKLLHYLSYLVCETGINAGASSSALDKLAEDFWLWRAKYAPFTGDDVNRIERPGGTRNWSRASIDKQRKDLAAFEARWKKLDATARKERIAIHGDYDVDGVTSTVILRRALELLGADVVHFIPERLKDGYGLQPAAIDRLHADGVALVVSVDCGIRGADAARRARELGLDLIITDHHEPDAELPPALAVINPKRRDCPYPDKYLAGVGGALKVVQALCRRAERGSWFAGCAKVA